MVSSKIFISYSHLDEPWKERVVKHLRTLQDEIEPWDDRRIPAGDDFLPVIETAMSNSVAAILLVSVDFLNSRFINEKEVPKLLARRRDEGMRVIPLIVRPCPWMQVESLKGIAARPKDGKPLTSLPENEAEQALSDLAVEVKELLSAKAPALALTATTPKVATSRLPNTGRGLHGRAPELHLLDKAWEEGRRRIMVLVGWGGMGKSSVVAEWRARMAARGFDGAARVFDWSFYNQGVSGGTVSSESFIGTAEEFFGVQRVEGKDSWARGERVAQAIGRERTLLILDGLEPLQQQFGPDVQEGRIVDPSILALLRTLADENRGVCVVTTRYRIPDLDLYPETYVLQHRLDRLLPEDGAKILSARGVAGPESELRRAAEEFGGHPLALTLLGGLLRDAFDGDVRRRAEVGDLTEDAQFGGHAKRVMRSYEHALGNGAELRILRLIGLFDRPAAAGALATLAAAPVISGLTEGLPAPGSIPWSVAIARLRRAGLVSGPNPASPGALDAHPLVREYFESRVRTELTDAWKEGNERLYAYYRDSAPEFPQTLQEMEPLFAAVTHGSRCERRQEVFSDVYYRRIDRGEAFSTMRLGAFAATLGALASLFRVPWTVPAAELAPEDQRWILNDAGINLMRAGRYSEAAPALAASMEQDRIGDPLNAGISAINLAELYLRTGPLSAAVGYAAEAVALAGAAEDDSTLDRDRAAAYLRISHAMHAYTLLLAGRTGEASEAMARARPEEAAGLSTAQYLHVSGLYSPLLLARRDAERARDVATHALAAARGQSAFEVARFMVQAGRAELAIAVAGRGDASEAAKLIQDGISATRSVHDHLLLLNALLVRAELRIYTGELSGAKKDLEEALQQAQLRNLLRYETDCHLGLAKAHRAGVNHGAAAISLREAERLVAELGYHLRDAEIAALRD